MDAITKGLWKGRSMTREQAKKYIGELKMYANSQGWDEEYQIACDIAMNELEQEPTTKNNLGVDCTPHFICSHDTNEEMEDIRNEIFSYDASFVEYTIEGHSDSDIEKIVENVINQFKDLVLDVVSNHITYETRTIANMENSKINRQEYRKGKSDFEE